jgi:hypothetical protein
MPSSIGLAPSWRAFLEGSVPRGSSPTPGVPSVASALSPGSPATGVFPSARGTRWASRQHASREPARLLVSSEQESAPNAGRAQKL